jgi:Zn-dependent peptidase ImmA (M78 family)
MNDFKAEKSRSDAEIRALAANWRHELGIRIDEWAPNLSKVLFESLPRAVPGFECIVVEDASMMGAAAKTMFNPPRIFLSKSIHERLLRWDGFARFTVAHEIGHLVMHAGEALYRKLEGNQRAAFIEPHRW